MTVGHKHREVRVRSGGLVDRSLLGILHGFTGLTLRTPDE